MVTSSYISVSVVNIMEAKGEDNTPILEAKQPAIDGPKVEMLGLLSEDVKNNKQLICLFCPSKILPPETGSYEDSKEYELQIVKKNENGVAHIAKEKLSQFYRVEDMFDFDNVGFSKTVDNMKYLICADCEAGPIGYHDLNTKKCYVAISRIKHE